MKAGLGVDNEWDQKLKAPYCNDKKTKGNWGNWCALVKRKNKNKSYSSLEISSTNLI